MYLAFKHSHLFTAILSMLLTVIWSVLAWNANAANQGGLSGKPRAIYIAHRAVGGLAGLTGVGVTFAGPWQMMIFPYVGLAAFVVHGIAAGISKRTFGDRQSDGKRRMALAVQLAALLLAAYVMMVKPAFLLTFPQLS